MLNIFLLLIGIMTSLCSLSAFAATESTCPEKELDRGSFEGIHLGTMCGEDFCASTFKLDNGEEFTMLCGEENAVSWFGKTTGQRILVNYAVLQFWNGYGNECVREDVCTGGTLMPPMKKSGGPAKAQPVIQELFKPDMLGATILYLEQMTGPAKWFDGDSARVYKIGECNVTIHGKTVIESMTLDVTPQCTFDLAPFLGRQSPLPAHALTFGQFHEETGGTSDYLSDCLRGCGNAYDPSVYMFYEGPRSNGFIDILVDAKQIGDVTVAATNAWAEVMEKEMGEDWVMENKFNCDKRFNTVAYEQLKNIHISEIAIGSSLFKPGCD